MPQDRHRVRLFAASCAGMFIFGVVLALLGTLFGLPAMRDRLGVNLAQQGDLFLLLFAGVCFATVAVGPLIDRFGNKLVLLLSALLVTLALVEFAAARSMLSASSAALLIGLGGGGLNTSSNVLTSELYEGRRGPMLNLLGIFYGFGALFIPLLAASITSLLPMPKLLLCTAVLPAFGVVVYAVLPFPPAREGHGMSWREIVEVVRYPGLLLFGLLLFIESGNEAVLAGWTSTYVGKAGAAAQLATWILAGYWAGLMLGRFSATRLLRHLRDVQLVLLSALGAMVGCAVLLGVRSVPVLAAVVVFSGFAQSAIFPTTLAMIGDRYRRYAATAFGVLFAIGLAGGAVFPWAVGHLSEERSLRAGMVLLLAGAGAVVVTAIVINHRVRGDRQAASN
ncbi:MAG TPA: MFS transporter [Terriglobales bacterium]|jgi:MFS transporter, FHS family, glucose/mannose:H+ symporter